MLPFKFTLRFKLLLVFILITSIPSIVFNLLWITKFENQVSLLPDYLYSSLLATELLAAIIYCFLIFLLGILSYILAKIILNPLEEIERWSRYIGLGMFTTRLHIKSRDEMQDLSYSFNMMASNLEDAFSKLKNDNEIILGERNKLEVIISAISDGIVSCDREHLIITFNKAAEKITGYTQEEVLGKKIGDFLHIYRGQTELSVQEYCPISSETEKRATSTKVGLISRGKNNKSADIEIISSHIEGNNHLGVGCILTIKDVSHEKDLERMKLNFVSTAAHELRTPLTSIKGYIYLIIQNYGETLTQQVKEYFDIVKISSDRLTGLVDNLLHATNIEKGTLTIHPSEQNWIAVLEDIVGPFIKLATEKNITFVFEKPDHEILVAVDKTQIREAVTNILKNALYYTAVFGKITIRVTVENSRVITHISDTGRGIPEEVLPNLFTQFGRESGNTLLQTSEGIGLGLFITKAIIDLHKGRIWVESKTGEGATFHFSLPQIKR